MNELLMQLLGFGGGGGPSGGPSGAPSGYPAGNPASLYNSGFQQQYQGAPPGYGNQQGQQNAMMPLANYDPATAGGNKGGRTDPVPRGMPTPPPRPGVLGEGDPVQRAVGRQFDEKWISGHPMFNQNWVNDPSGGYMQRRGGASLWGQQNPIGGDNRPGWMRVGTQIGFTPGQKDPNTYSWVRDPRAQ